MTEIEKVRLPSNLNYAMGLQFLERLEKGGKVNTMEKNKLRYSGRWRWKPKTGRYAGDDEERVEENEGCRE